MWSHESLYGVIGSKVGDFIETYGVSNSLQEGVFTHRAIAEQLIETFSGLKMNEILWRESIRTYFEQWKATREKSEMVAG